MRSRSQAIDQTVLLNQAAALHQRGALAEAAARYRRIIERNPAHAEALYQLARISCRQGRFAEGIALARRAAAAEPQAARSHALMGHALAALGETREALASFDRAIACEDRHAGYFGDRGDVLVRLRRLGEAVDSYRQAIALEPEAPAYWRSLGAALSDLGRHEEALAALERALTLAPDDAGALVAYGGVLRVFGRPEEALASYDRALSLAPKEVPALMGRTAALAALDRPDDALRSLDLALAIVPVDADSLSLRGHLLRLLRRHDEALETLNHALEIEPDHAEALAYRGMVLLDLGQASEAVHSYRRALAIDPTPDCHSRLIAALDFDPDVSAADRQAERLQWNEQHARLFSADVPPHRNVPDRERRLRIGYIGSHFGRQATTFAFASVIAHRDRDRFEAVCYSSGGPDDEVRQRMRQDADIWRQIGGWSNEDVAQCMRDDAIDILVDVAGHSGDRLLVFARKPAPVQVTGWADPAGTGLASMDYVFVDAILAPADQRTFLVEKPYELPSCFGYWMPEQLPAPSPLPAMARGYVTFGSFNRIAKIQDPVVRCWAAILRAQPSARMIIKSELRFDDGGRRLDIERLFEDEGVDADRVEFRGPCGRAEHLAAHEEVDIALDPFPYSGGMSALDALSMGVPVITLTGRAISSRLAASSLTTLGLTDFITASRRDYVDVAVGMARDVMALAYLRASLRGLFLNSAIGDPVRYARSVEAAYRAMWHKWCAGAGSGGKA